ncbi:hypothetical protein EVAR_5391_1 [Eumeta japonica]|uniref:Uncharacterized protein n=1 Tax=Eumeta variegata TaxID=151549 RepID=A0A4C1T750_EUMVA|nr:hypothetical protein EVAR_5391_1 [Eumeta japonica]
MLPIVELDHDNSHRFGKVQTKGARRAIGEVHSDELHQFCRGGRAERCVRVENLRTSFTAPHRDPASLASLFYPSGLTRASDPARHPVVASRHRCCERSATAGHSRGYRNGRNRHNLKERGHLDLLRGSSTAASPASPTLTSATVRPSGTTSDSESSDPSVTLTSPRSGAGKRQKLRNETRKSCTGLRRVYVQNNLYQKPKRQYCGSISFRQNSVDLRLSPPAAENNISDEAASPPPTPHSAAETTTYEPTKSASVHESRSTPTPSKRNEIRVVLRGPEGNTHRRGQGRPPSQNLPVQSVPHTEPFPRAPRLSSGLRHSRGQRQGD